MAGRKRFGASGLRPPASTQSAEEDAAIAAIHSHLEDENISVAGAALASPVTKQQHSSDDVISRAEHRHEQVDVDHLELVPSPKLSRAATLKHAGRAMIAFPQERSSQAVQSQRLLRRLALVRGGEPAPQMSFGFD